MQDFNDFASKDNNPNGKKQSIIDIVTKIASDFDGKSQTELIRAIYDEARKGKANGTLSNQEIDGFYSVLYPMLDEKKRKILSKIVDDLKKL